jgi:chorismate mutase
LAFDGPRGPLVAIIRSLSSRRPRRLTTTIRERKPAPMLRCRGIRGATTVEENTREAILAATRELLALLVARNAVAPEEIASAFFTVTEDLDAEHPARAARQLGWDDVALLCAREIPVPGDLPRCIRVLLHVNTARPANAIRHVYLRRAVALRPTRADLAAVGGASEMEGPR